MCNCNCCLCSLFDLSVLWCLILLVVGSPNSERKNNGNYDANENTMQIRILLDRVCPCSYLLVGLCYVSICFYEQQFCLINPKFQVVIDNGLLQLTLSNPGGLIRGIQYNGIDNLLELHNQDLNGGYLTSLFGQAFPIS